MANTMISLKVMTHEGELLNKTVNYVKFFSCTGDVGVYPGHTTSIIKIDGSDLIYETDGEVSESVYIGSGVVTIRDDNVIVLTETCLFSDQIDQKEEEKRLDAYEATYRETMEHFAKEEARQNRLSAEAKLRVVTH